MTVAQVISLFDADVTKDFYIEIGDIALDLKIIEGCYYHGLNNIHYVCDATAEEIEIDDETYLVGYAACMPLIEYMEKEVTHIDIVDSEYIEIYAR